MTKIALLPVLFQVLLAQAQECPCPDDTTIRIGGVSHGDESDTFWDPVFQAAFRSASDSNVELDFERFKAVSQNSDDAAITDMMVKRIETLCSSEDAVDGVFSTLWVGTAVLDALESKCVAKNIPTVVINSGLEMLQKENATDDFLHFVGTDEYQTGYKSGEKLKEVCPGCKFFCLDHCSNCTSWRQRCKGFAAAVGSSPHILVDTTSTDTYISSISDVVCGGTLQQDQQKSEEGPCNWANTGFLAGTQSSMFPFTKELVDMHPEVKVAGIDTSDDLFENLGGESGILWGTDQQPYLQGYIPVQVLANKVRLGQSLTGPLHLETGPQFEDEARSGEELCADDPFAQCASGEEPEPASSSPLLFSAGTFHMLFALLLGIVPHLW